MIRSPGPSPIGVPLAAAARARRDVLDWFRIALRHGYFASLRGRTNDHRPAEVSAGSRLDAVLAARAKYLLALPYGPQALAIGLGFLDPPWKSKPPERTRRNRKLKRY